MIYCFKTHTTNVPSYVLKLKWKKVRHLDKFRNIAKTQTGNGHVDHNRCKSRVVLDLKAATIRISIKAQVRIPEK
jgi:hypothetical protein